MCKSCNELNINGINCHETGCPDSWKNKKVECKWCGQLFSPEFKNQVFCSVECKDDYTN